MTKHRFLRTPLAAVIGLLAFLVVPAAAQAHHVNTSAECVLENNVPTIQLTAYFIGFSSTKNVTGKVNVDEVRRFPAAPNLEFGPVPVEWGYQQGKPDDGRWTFKYATTPGPHTVQADFTWSNEGTNDDQETLYTKTCPPPEEPATPAIVLDKTGAATAAAGSTFTYSFKATNIGNVTLTNVVLTDDKCQSTLTRLESNPADPTFFDPGDEWFYTCTVVAPAGPAQVDNVAKVCGDFVAGGDAETITVCDDDPHTFTVPPPGTPPGDNPPNSTPNVVPPPSGDVLPEAIASGRASLRGPSGCVKQAFQARVKGRSIASVTFFVDGRRVKTVNGKRVSYSIKVRPSTYGFGRHKIVARVVFTTASGTKARNIPLTFRRCAQGATDPRFTG
jgi:hypothetical protein